MKKMKGLLLLLILSLATVASVPAQTKVRVKFAPGASAARLKGKVTGYGYADYVVRAGAGQTMSVELTSNNAFAQLVVFDQTMENLDGATGVEQWTGELPSGGNYTIRVLLPRAEARRKGAAANFALRISIR